MDFTVLGKALFGALGSWLGLLTLPGRERTGLGDALIGGAISGLLAGRIGWMLLNGVNPLRRPLDLLVRGEVSVGLAGLGALGFLVWNARSDLAHRLDRLAVPTLLGLAGWHGGCFLRDTCVGTETALPWAMTVGGSTTGRHPVEFYVVLGLLASGLALWLLRTRLRPGVSAGVALLVVAGMRLLTHPVRLTIDDSVVWWAAAGLAIAVGWIGWCLATGSTDQHRSGDMLTG